MLIHSSVKTNISLKEEEEEREREKRKWRKTFIQLNFDF